MGHALRAPLSTYLGIINNYSGYPQHQKGMIKNHAELKKNRNESTNEGGSLEGYGWINIDHKAEASFGTEKMKAIEGV